MSRPVIDPELEQVTSDHLGTLADLIAKDRITNAELRSISGILRSLLVYDELSKVAAARSHKLLIGVPDSDDVLRRVDADPAVLFLQLGGYRAFGLDVSLALLERRAGATPMPFDPSERIGVKLGAFKSQVVFVTRITTHPAKGYAPPLWKKSRITRENVISFAANKLGGRHYDPNRDEDHHIALEAIRRAAMTDLNGDVVQMSMDPRVFQDPAYRASKRPSGIGIGMHHQLDPVLVEVLGAATLLLESPSVAELRDLLGT